MEIMAYILNTHSIILLILNAVGLAGLLLARGSEFGYALSTSPHWRSYAAHALHKNASVSHAHRSSKSGYLSDSLKLFYKSYLNHAKY